VQLILGIVIAGAIALSAVRMRLLQPSGGVATLVLGSIVFGLGGIPWSLPLVTFFLLSSLLSRVGAKRYKGYRERVEVLFEKGSTRDAGQVIANGGVAGLLVLFYQFHPHPSLFVAYLGSLAAAAADTWGTEIGVLNRGVVVSPWRLRAVPAGTGGGISLVGSLGAVTGALSVALSGIWWVPGGLPASLGIVVAAGILGMLADSLIGDILQAHYRCAVCGASTERSLHCDETATLVAGYRWITNDVVNIICCAVGGIFAYLLHAFVVG
jgi:uncharacterized protein (TIGR00297 family)